MAEHMLILGLENPKGEVKYICAAFPSACGKTNLAMLIPPEGYRNKGYKIWCVGDDISWIRIGSRRQTLCYQPRERLLRRCPRHQRAVQPQRACQRQRRIPSSQTLLLTSTTTPFGGKVSTRIRPQNAIDWKGRPWDRAKYDKQTGQACAHPNSRFTAPADNCPCISSEFENPAGVPISAIVFGGRRAKLAPLVYQSRSWNHGVFVGSIMASETTAAAAGAVGVVRRDPMAMLPFCGYNMADYWQHWIDIGAGLDEDKAPKIFNVNWFRKDDDGNFLWPGFGDNMRVLEWIIKRCEGKVDAEETAIGFVPKAEDINLEGIEDEVSEDQLKEILSVDNSLWEDEAKGIEEFYAKFGDRLPKALSDELNTLKANLEK